MNAQVPPTFPPTKSMDGKTQGVKLSLNLIDSDYVAATTNAGEGELQLKPATGTVNDPKLYSCRPANLVAFLAAPNKTGSLKVIDVRSVKDKAVMKKQFSGVIPILMENDSNAVDKLKTWKASNATTFADLLQASYVVIHCNEGETRSPAMVKAYAAAWKAATNKNQSQSIALLHRGHRGFLASGGLPYLVDP